MQKFLVVFCLAFFIDRAETQNAHLDKLKKEFPLGLISDDYGILEIQDLRSNACVARPYAFLKGEWGIYEIWQCFEVKKSNFDCEIGGRDDDTKEIMAMLVIFGQRGKESHEFISRRPISLMECRDRQADWRKMIKNEKYVCVSGSFPGKELVKGVPGWVWFFGRYKTRKGCESYFADECEPRPKCKVMPPV